MAEPFAKLPLPLEGLVVAELGGREAAAVCGTLLAHLGADVAAIGITGQARPKDALKVSLGPGKRFVSLREESVEDAQALRRLLARSDIVLASSDLDPRWLHHERSAGQIRCDIFALGRRQKQAGKEIGEWDIQALTGMADTTGWSDGPPVPISLPVVGYSTGINAATAVLAALSMRRRDGAGVDIEVSMYDSAFVAMNAYFAGLFTGGVPDRKRAGNRHTTVAPWNMYPTRDGSIQICAGSEGQWEALCAAMFRRDLPARFATQATRLDLVDELDAEIAAWTQGLTTAACEIALAAAGVAASAVVKVEDCPTEPNLVHRKMIVEEETPGGVHRFAGSPFSLRGAPATNPAFAANERHDVRPPKDAQHASASAGADRKPPLTGLRVVELGQYTTAPMCGRLLAHLGADVIKVEKPGGDDQRKWVPAFHGMSETFWLNNIDKRAISLDLGNAEDRAVVVRLLASADILVENNRPGALARFDLAPEEMLKRNPRLIYCAVSGFGADSLYPGRPGFDTVIQAASGFMAAVNLFGEPVKSGFSAADVVGAQIALASILAALEARHRTDLGQFIDVSMQDVTAWLTSPVWEGRARLLDLPRMAKASDGYVMTCAAGDTDDHHLSRDGLVRSIAQRGGKATVVRTIREAVSSPETLARRIWFSLPHDGVDWPALGLPFTLTSGPRRMPRHAPTIDQDREAILAELNQLRRPSLV